MEKKIIVKKLYQIKDEVLVLVGKSEVKHINKNDPKYKIVKLNDNVNVNSPFEENLELELRDWILAEDEKKIKEKILKKVGL